MQRYKPMGAPQIVNPFRVSMGQVVVVLAERLF
jgi:hypothetical protein